MAHVILDSMVRLPKDKLSLRQMEKIRKGLKLKRPDHNGRMIIVRAYKEENGHICLPRQWEGARQILERNEYLDQRSPGSTVDLTFDSGEGWRRGQLEFRDAVVRGILDDELGGIAKAGCGFGKTVMACAIAAEMGLTTLILVHTDALKRQWMQEVRTFLGEEPGVVQEDVCEFRDKKVVIAMVQSLAAKRYDEDLYTWPGLVIQDECHHVSARTFWEAITSFHSKYYLGLTATPRRSDGLQNIFFWTIGQILAEGYGDYLDCRVWRVIFHPDIQWDELEDKRGDASFGKFLKLLSVDPVRNRMLARVMAKAVRSGRKLLVLTKYLDHIDDLKHRLRQTFKEAGEEFTVEHFCSGKTKMALAQRDRARAADVCLGTDRIAQEGFNIPDLDTLVLALPIKDMEQAAGRIRRLLTGKKEPMIVDVHDQHAFARNMNKERLRFYAARAKDKKPWPIHTVK